MAGKFPGGTVKFKRGSDGIYINIAPDAAIEFAEIASGIRHLNLGNVDSAAVKDAFNSLRGQDVLIFKTGAVPSLDARLEVKVSADGMTASAVYYPPKPLGLDLDDKVLETRLKLKGIKFGIIENAQDAVKSSPGTWVLVARGREPVDSLELPAIIPVASARSDPLETAERLGAKTDMDLDKIQFIIQAAGGDVIGKFPDPWIENKDGMTVTGQSLPALDIAGPGLGPYVVVDADGIGLRAVFWGQIVYENQRAEVIPFNILAPENLIGAKKIQFAGTLEIQADVGDDYVIFAEHDILIRGTVGKSKISAGGSVYILGDPVSIKGGEIQSGKDILLKSAQDARLGAHGSVLIHGRASNCQIEAWERVVANGKDGTIAGGKILVGKGVKARALTKHQDTPPIIEIATMKLEVGWRKEQLSIARNNLAVYVRQIEAVDELMKLPLTPERKALIEARMQKIIALISGLEEWIKKLERVEAWTTEGAFLDVEKTVQAGARILLGSSPQDITKTVEGIRLVCSKGEIELNAHGELSELTLDQLRPGMILAELVVDRNGNTLLPQKTRLTPKDLKRLSKFGFETIKVFVGG